MRKQLTQRQETFCLNIFQGMTQREAYIQAGYSTKSIPAILDIRACELAKHSKVLVRIAELNVKAREEAERAEAAAISTVNERKRILTQIQRATVGDFVDEFGNLSIEGKGKLNSSAVQEVKTERTLVGIRTTLKLRDTVGAIAEHNKMEHVYETSPNINVDNRQVNIYVYSERTKELLLKVKERTGKLIGGNPMEEG